VRLSQSELALATGSRTTLLPGGGTSVVGRLTFGAGATLDITDNALVIDYASESPIAAIREQIVAGRGGAGVGNGAWTGTGITSSSAAAANAVDAESRSVGYVENASLPLGPYATFRGQVVDDTAVLIVYARTSDTNLNGAVNDDDVTIIGATYMPGAQNSHWALGDFDYNGFVDDDDVTLLGAFYDAAAAPLAPPGGGVEYEGRSTEDEFGTAEALLETFGQEYVRGQETRAQLVETRAQLSQETRAQLVMRDGWSGIDHELVDLLAESIAREQRAGNRGQRVGRVVGSRQ
jgi:hypothetical protein